MHIHYIQIEYRKSSIVHVVVDGYRMYPKLVWDLFLMSLSLKMKNNYDIIADTEWRNVLVYSWVHDMTQNHYVWHISSIYSSPVLCEVCYFGILQRC